MTAVDRRPVSPFSAFHLHRAQEKRARRRERNRRVWGDRAGHVYKRRRLIP